MKKPEDECNRVFYVSIDRTRASKEIYVMRVTEPDYHGDLDVDLVSGRIELIDDHLIIRNEDLSINRIGTYEICQRLKPITGIATVIAREM